MKCVHTSSLQRSLTLDIKPFDGPDDVTDSVVGAGQSDGRLALLGVGGQNVDLGAGDALKPQDGSPGVTDQIANLTSRNMNDSTYGTTEKEREHQTETYIGSEQN